MGPCELNVCEGQLGLHHMLWAPRPGGRPSHRQVLAECCCSGSLGPSVECSSVDSRGSVFLSGGCTSATQQSPNFLLTD